MNEPRKHLRSGVFFAFCIPASVGVAAWSLRAAAEMPHQFLVGLGAFCIALTVCLSILAFWRSIA